jgi:hypothetical protein
LSQRIIYQNLVQDIRQISSPDSARLGNDVKIPASAFIGNRDREKGCDNVGIVVESVGVLLTRCTLKASEYLIKLHFRRPLTGSRFIKPLADILESR